MKEEIMNKKVLLQELTDGLARRKGITKKDADAFVRVVFEVIEQYLESDKIVKIKGLGSFKLVSVDSRESVNVNTGERIRIKGHTKISFTPDAVLRDQVNKPFAEFETVILSDGINLDEMEQVDAMLLEMPGKASAESVAEPETVIESETLVEVKQQSVEEGLEQSEPDAVREDIAPSQEVSVQAENVAMGTLVSESLSEETTVAAEKVMMEDVDETEEEQTELAAEENPVPPVVHIDSQHSEFQKVEEQHVGDLKVDSQHVAHQTIEHQNIVQEHVPVEAPKGLRLSNAGLLGLAMFVLLLMIGSYFAGYYQLLCPCNFDFLQEKEESEKIASSVVAPVRPATKRVKGNTMKTGISADSISRMKQQTSVLRDTAKSLSSDTVTIKGPLPKVTPKKAEARPKQKHAQVPQGKYIIVGTRRAHTVAYGETLRSIAFEEYGSKGYASYIIVHNNIANPDEIPAGKVLKLPELKLREE